jgi:hypothetical protein
MGEMDAVSTSRCRPEGTSAYISHALCVVLERVMRQRAMSGDLYVTRNGLIREALEFWLGQKYPNGGLYVDPATDSSDEEIDTRHEGATR